MGSQRVGHDWVTELNLTERFKYTWHPDTLLYYCITLSIAHKSWWHLSASFANESESCSAASNSATPWTVSHWTPLSIEFSRQEYWSGLPFTSPGDLPNSGIKPRSPALQVYYLPSEPPGEAPLLLLLSWLLPLGLHIQSIACFLLLFASFISYLVRSLSCVSLLSPTCKDWPFIYITIKSKDVFPPGGKLINHSSFAITFMSLALLNSFKMLKSHNFFLMRYMIFFLMYLTPFLVLEHYTGKLRLYSTL